MLTGGDADDQVLGEAGDDRMIWNPGDDTDLFEGGAGNDTAEVNGGDGSDLYRYLDGGTRVLFERTNPAPFSIDIGKTENLVLNMNGGNDSFSATGDLAALIKLTIDGGAGERRRFSAAMANDDIRGDTGNDMLTGGDGHDFVFGGDGNDTALMGAGDDLFFWIPVTTTTSSKVRTASTPFSSVAPISPSTSTSRPTAGGRPSSATSPTSPWTSTASRTSSSRRSAAPTTRGRRSERDGCDQGRHRPRGRRWSGGYRHGERHEQRG